MTKKGDIKISSSNYPERLKEICSPPKSLRFKGSFDKNLFENTLAVVGSRKITPYGKAVVEKLVYEIASYGITIVSGFMYGVDALAHQTAINANGKTIAVLPCGVDVIHPSYQQKLYQQVLENGFFLSEYEDNTKPEKWTYPKRNRIVVGISKATLVVEAEEKSGSMISASLAQKYNRKIFAIPGSIFSSRSSGTNYLLKNGASVVTSSSDILRFYGKEKKIEDIEDNSNISKDELLILQIIKENPSQTDEIVKKVKKDASFVAEILSTLEINGLVEKKGKMHYIKKP